MCYIKRKVLEEGAAGAQLQSQQCSCGRGALPSPPVPSRPTPRRSRLLAARPAGRSPPGSPRPPCPEPSGPPPALAAHGGRGGAATGGAGGCEPSAGPRPAPRRARRPEPLPPPLPKTRPRTPGTCTRGRRLPARTPPGDAAPAPASASGPFCSRGQRRQPPPLPARPGPGARGCS